jgi:PBP1b-binding outer membrane lipoprotein LpoB
MRRLPALLLTLVLPVAVLTAGGCRAKQPFNVRDVDPSTPGVVRSLGPESQDATQVADLMMRSLIQSRVIAATDTPPTIAMLPMVNNTRFAFNQEVFTTLLRARLNKNSGGAMRFVQREVMEDIQNERAAKRTGEVDYDPDRRTHTVAGADFFLRGRVDGLSSASTMGQAEYAVYAFELIDTETSLVLWEDYFDVKKEGRDDVLYR